jgi:hypothetical protein
LVAPRLSIPLEKVTWQVLVPRGYRVADYTGNVRLAASRDAGDFALPEYRRVVAELRGAETGGAAALLQSAAAFLGHGQVRRAGEALLRATETGNLDAASNEDARVQLRTLRTRQTLAGVNTRRQRLTLERDTQTSEHAEAGHATTANPLLQGKADVDGRDLEPMLAGNSVDENTALRVIAGRIVDQQLSTEPATAAIDVKLPERGRVLTFTRQLQLNGSAPLQLELTLAAEAAPAAWPAALALSTVALLALAIRPLRSIAVTSGGAV